MIFEVCANSIQSAINAENGGAHRIELCSGLEIGGITPSYGLILEAKKKLTIPIHVLIRPRSGHFVYSKSEIDIMKKDIQFCKENGIEGVVVGMLTKEGEVDVKVLKELMSLARPMKVAFHRAFDRAKNPFAAFENLMECQVDILLTSGQQPSVVSGLDLISKLVERSEGKMEILPGGGINAINAFDIIRQTNVKSIHFSVSENRIDSEIYSKEQLESSFKYLETGEKAVRKVVEVVSALD